MKPSEVLSEVTRLFESFPKARVTDGNAQAYCEALVDLPYADALHDAVTDLVASEDWLPSIALVRQTYHRHHDKYLPLALPVPELSDEERLENIRQMNALRDHVTRREGHTPLLEDCSNPYCQRAAEEARRTDV